MWSWIEVNHWHTVIHVYSFKIQTWICICYQTIDLCTPDQIPSTDTLQQTLLLVNFLHNLDFNSHAVWGIGLQPFVWWDCRFKFCHGTDVCFLWMLCHAGTGPYPGGSYQVSEWGEWVCVYVHMCQGVWSGATITL